MMTMKLPPTTWLSGQHHKGLELSALIHRPAATRQYIRNDGQQTATRTSL